MESIDGIRFWKLQTKRILTIQDTCSVFWQNVEAWQTDTFATSLQSALCTASCGKRNDWLLYLSRLRRIFLRPASWWGWPRCDWLPDVWRVFALAAEGRRPSACDIVDRLTLQNIRQTSKKPCHRCDDALPHSSSPLKQHHSKWTS